MFQHDVLTSAQRKVLHVQIRCRRFCRRRGPVALGQTKYAFYFSAALIALWFFGQPIEAQAEIIQGSSEDEYLRVEWLYDLDQGLGSLWLTSLDDPYSSDLIFNSSRFIIRGYQYQNLAGTLAPLIESSYVGQSNGVNVYEYLAQEENSLDNLLRNSAITAYLSFSYPTRDVSVFMTQMEYTTSLSASPLPPLAKALNFVSIQSIPEPSTGAAAVAVASALALNRRRRHHDWLDEEEK